MDPDGKLEKGTGIALADIEGIAETLVQQAGNIKVWLFHGELGAGKTTLIKAVCKVLGVSDAMGSPTFSIVNEYFISPHKKVYHFDFYRIKNEAEAFDIGTDEYFYSGHYCFIEWPEKIPSLIPETYVDVNISIEDNTHRAIVISVHDRQEENRI
jgi:tRNA threonylcarbamoyladenosine biosynthesis protein TsaE